VSDVPPESGRFEGVCPHCRKEFVAELLVAPSAHQAGFKCPHCKLFVPHERSLQESESPASS
jgi:hypothetical protein